MDDLQSHYDLEIAKDAIAEKLDRSRSAESGRKGRLHALGRHSEQALRCCFLERLRAALISLGVTARRV